jgi:HAD superfamily hydrolase (TIGR01549 family)
VGLVELVSLGVKRILKQGLVEHIFNWLGVKSFIFDWGDTVMRDFPEKPGPMWSWDKVEWIPDTEKLLKEISSRYIMVIATNAGVSDTTDMIRALERVGAEKYFRYFFSSKELGYEKPDQRFFMTISERIGVPPQNCVMIGNLYEKDITGAKLCGMGTILLNETNKQGFYPDADIVIQGFNELFGFFTGKK